MANYSYVVDSSFQPFSMQEMLVPFSAYKDAFEKGEEAYNDLTDKSDKFKYLSDTLPEGSRARQLYEGYANDLKTQAEDLAHNGLTMTNRRALTSLKRRYQGEIGRLIKADEAMDVEKKLRQSLNAQDSSRLYATDNLNIDDFLDGRNPNLYSISGNELYTRGAAAGKAASSRVFSAGDEGSTLGGYYRDYVQRMGYGADTMQKFREDMSAIPELQMAADAILEERGVPQNLTGVNLQRARQSVINGMIDGAVYQEQHSPQRDLGVIDAATQEQLKLQKQELALKALAASKPKTETSSSKGSKGDYPLPTNTEYIPGNNRGNVKLIEDGYVPNSGTKVKITVDDAGNYTASIGEDNAKTGEKALLLGKINAKGDITDIIGTSDDDYNNFNKYFSKGEHWWTVAHTYDPEYDIDNIKSMLKDVLDIANKGGGQSYKNYEYYLEPDNTGYHNDGGGFYRRYIGNTSGTIFNQDPRVVDMGEEGYGIHGS